MNKEHMRRHPFSEQEDELLRGLVAERGESDWSEISALLAVRTPRQRKERWMHHLSPHLVHEKWSTEEDDLLRDLVNEQGKKWKVFEGMFAGRTDISLKNRHNVLARKKEKERKIALKLPLKSKWKPVEPPIEMADECDSFIEPVADGNVLRCDWNSDFPFF
jgi:hypothetical protein